MTHVSSQHSSPGSEAQTIYLGALGAHSLRRRVPGCQRGYWSWASTLWSREKVVTSPRCQPALPTGQGSSGACFKSWPSAGMLQELITVRQLEYGDCRLQYWYVFIYILSLLLLRSLIHLNKSAAIIYSYPPRETCIFSELRCALYLAQHSSAPNSCLHSNSNPTCTPSPIQTVAVCCNFYFCFLFTWCFSSFLLCPSPPPLQSVCVGGEMGWILGPVAFSQSLLQSPLQTSQTILSCSVVTDDFSLSETGVNPGSGEVLKGVGGKCQASGFTQFVNGTRVGAITEEHGRGLWWGVQYPPESRYCTWEGRGVQTPTSSGRKLSKQTRGCGSGR